MNQMLKNLLYFVAQFIILGLFVRTYRFGENHETMKTIVGLKITRFYRGGVGPR